ncbi:MAG TPA: hypothetical protein VHH88_07840 [Verrucomicrobiae bacterium]|nr:hypothetical protein [Verrucomicrobiae bacterium]
MPEQQARVSSIDAIESFRSALILFLSKARPALEEVVGEVTRTRLWVGSQQKAHWQTEIKKRSRELERAQGELFSARLSRVDKPSAAQQMAVHRAQASVRQADEKLRIVKKWDREIENRTEPMVKQIEQLHGFMVTDMGKAVAYLTEILKILQSYAEQGGALSKPAPAAAAPSSDGEAAGESDPAKPVAGPNEPAL